MTNSPQAQSPEAPELVTRNSETLAQFIFYCEQHPDERFWQALRNWSGWNLILASNDSDPDSNPLVVDTFYFEGKGSGQPPSLEERVNQGVFEVFRDDPRYQPGGQYYRDPEDQNT